MKKKIIFLLLSIATLFTGIMDTRAITPDNSITFYHRTLEGVNKQSGATTSFKYVKTSYNSAIVGYCLNHSLNVPSNGANLSLKEDITTPAYLYIFEHGVGTSGAFDTSLLGNLTIDQAYYATQLAIWIYQGKVNISSLDSNTPEVAGAIKLYQNAIKTTSTSSNISLNAASNSMTQTTYNGSVVYRSNLISVNGANKTYTILVEGNQNAKILSENGTIITSGTTVAAGTRFYVQTTSANTSVTVKVTTSVNTNKVYRYTTGNSTEQDIGIIVPTTENKSASLNLTATSPVGSLKITKVDVSSGSEVLLSGVTIKVLNSSGTVIDTFTTNESNNPYVINNLPVGTYTIVEEKAPAGYIKIGNVEATVNNNETTEVKLRNSKSSSSVKISKLDVTTGSILPGATLIVKDAAGAIIEKWVSTNEPHYIYNLSAGEYTLIETSSPSGYGLSDEIIKFTVENDGGIEKEVIMYNSPIPVTADINITLLFTGAILCIGIIVFSTIKLIKKH